jgi:uncharacterized membrane protein YesL
MKRGASYLTLLEKALRYSGFTSEYKKTYFKSNEIYSIFLNIFLLNSNCQQG